MKHKLILLAAIFLIISFALFGCTGENAVDVGDYAIIKLPNGEVVEGEIQGLTRWSSSMTEVTIDGITYCIHPVNIAVVDKGGN